MADNKGGGDSGNCIEAALLTIARGQGSGFGVLIQKFHVVKPKLANKEVVLPLSKRVLVRHHA